MKKVLVFGGCGFLGHYLVNELLNRDYEVTVADIHENEKLDSNITYITCDINSKESVENAFKNKQFDFVYNLAGFANLDVAIQYPIETIKLNVIGNMYILEQCVKNNISRFVYASSAYAMSNKGSFYGISKLASEKIVEEYLKKYSLSFTILRYGSVYSDRPYDNNYIYNLIKTAVLEGEINHNGDGNELREYIHAEDASKLSVDVIESEAYKNLHVILTGNERMKRSDLFNMIKEILNGKVDINYREDGYHNHYNFTPYSFEPSVSRKLSANPHIDMGQGLLKCIRSVLEDKK
ncbi:MAG: UDP-glucose 4-epimerase [Candidatus Marinimicrobia bacterium]|nr:UDP-glucose 4-epimerase [Candidatus Neomarinimicrobiota bacterium]|tara:strand:+ start:747 stop:1628 length:882 start_codon:yes stop_codon:yes gene_type:complete